MRFEVLGPLRVIGDDGPVAISGGLQALLLGLLLSRDGHPVATSDLIEALWGANPPQDPHRDLRVNVTRLRNRLGSADRIPLASGRYSLRLEPGELDAAEFETGIRQARAAFTAGDADAAAELIGGALTLWRGSPYGGLEDNVNMASAIQRLTSRRVEALERLADIDLQRGALERVITDLPDLITEFPNHERFVAQLMTALDRAGRRADALAVYRAAYRRLTSDHGVDPGADLQRLHQDILRADPTPRFAKSNHASPTNTQSTQARLEQSHLRLPRIRTTGRRSPVMSTDPGDSQAARAARR